MYVKRRTHFLSYRTLDVVISVFGFSSIHILRIMSASHSAEFHFKCVLVNGIHRTDFESHRYIYIFILF